jgi:hypothetical protein
VTIMTPARRDPSNKASDAIEKSANKEEVLFSQFAALTGDRGKEDNGKQLLPCFTICELFNLLCRKDICSLGINIVS